jgi:hypothetical protein
MKFSPLPCYLPPLRPKYSPQHAIPKHPQLTCVPVSMSATKFYTHTKQQAFTYCSLGIKMETFLYNDFQIMNYM